MSYHFITKAKLPTVHGMFDIHIFENDEQQDLVLLTVCLLTTDPEQVTLVRILSV